MDEQTQDITTSAYQDERDELADLGMEESQPDNLLLEAIRAARAEAAERHIYDMDVPGFRGLLVLRLVPVGGRKGSIIRERWQQSKSPDKDTNLNADTIIAALQEVCGRTEATGPVKPLDPEVPVILDDRLTRLLGLEVPTINGQAPTARQVLFTIFGAAHDPDLAIQRCGGEFMEWASGADAQVSEEALGES